jgi:uncharacterized membrane protein
MSLAARRPLGRGRRAIWLTVHVLAAVSWIAAVMGSLGLGIGLATWPVDAAAVNSLNHLITRVTWTITIPSALVTVATGWPLSHAYRRRQRAPHWLTLKAYLTGLVFVLGAILLASGTSVAAYLGPARTAGFLALVAALALSVMRPDCRKATRGTTVGSPQPASTAPAGGRHRA